MILLAVTLRKLIHQEAESYIYGLVSNQIIWDMLGNFERIILNLLVSTTAAHSIESLGAGESAGTPGTYC